MARYLDYIMAIGIVSLLLGLCHPSMIMSSPNYAARHDYVIPLHDYVIPSGIMLLLIILCSRVTSYRMRGRGKQTPIDVAPV